MACATTAAASSVAANMDTIVVAALQQGDVARLAKERERMA